MNTTPRTPDWIDRLPWLLLLLLTAWLSVAPIHPEPHLIEKTRMLFSGSLTQPLDIFDLVLHSAPWVLVIIKLRRRSGPTPTP
ncbi:MAG: hypothetical protein HQM02_07040 [Magnetococcales bacterium]|nr:hypothetical protein [Magnetococcales bacterium]